MAKQRAFIDCDPGQDDALAIMLAARHLDIVGVASVAGNASIENTTTNALRLLELVRVAAPVFRGAAGPLVGDAITAIEVHGQSGLDGVDIAAPTQAVDPIPAAQALVDLDSDVPIVAVGPLTNLALALGLDERFGMRTGAVYVMGGSTTIGNVTSVAEFNIYADPEAAARVFASPLSITLATLDLTRQFQSDDGMLETLEAAGTPIAKAAAQVLTFLHERMISFTGERRSAMHDPCAVLALTHPELFEFQSCSAAVETDGRLTRGMTVIDQRARAAEGNIRFARTIDAAAAREVLLDALMA